MLYQLSYTPAGRHACASITSEAGRMQEGAAHCVTGRYGSDCATMTRALVNAHCATLPGAEVSDPWGGGHDAWKIGGKMFAVVGMAEDGVSVKCPDVETAALLIEVGRATRAPYFHRSWVRVPWGLVSDDEMRDRMTDSYRLIRSGLTKKAQAALPPF